MSGPDDSAEAPPQPQGCFCGFVSALWKIVKVILHVAILIIVFVLILPGLVSSLGAKIALQSVSYTILACLYIFTSSDRAERIVYGVFLGILATVIVAVAPSVKSRSRTAPVWVMFSCNLVALLVYCIWKISRLVQACLRGLRARGSKAPVADPEAPLTPLKKAAELCVTPPVLQTTLHIEDLPRKFSYDEIRAVTGDFGNMVGRGGSAEVFRGVLDDGTAVAVKRITSYKPVGEEEFLREITIVANVHQRSLVRLLGYCLLRGGAGVGHSQFLVYPFFEHGSLDWWLFHGEERRLLLPWPARRRIAGDVARALAYLHHECRRQILHLDIKPANILLDGSLRAHVSDFGISVSIAQDVTSVDTRGRGTPGYMAPEIWFSSLSTKSDVYSYGMTVLELVAGRRGYQAEEAPDMLARVVREKVARGELMEVVDAVMSSVDEGEVEAVVKVALCCVQHQRELRPTMATVVEMLEGRVAADLPPESRPLPIAVEEFMEPPRSLFTSSVDQNGGTGNNVSSFQ
ncbi:unnamed protein product [Urochloa humidicola]